MVRVLEDASAVAADVAVGTMGGKVYEFTMSALLLSYNSSPFLRIILGHRS
jgi:hypothetical protein